MMALLCVSCSGGDPPPAEPGPTPTPTPTPVAQNDPPENDVPPPGNPLPSPQMVEQIIAGRVLDHPQVKPYLHLEVAANNPLSILPVPELAQGAPNVRVDGQPVRVVTDPAQARFHFTAYERTPGTSRVRVRFTVPAEGVTGHVDLELRNYVWEYVDASVVEN